mmetsp:Transcript_21920/g.70830  ORF Transcript_21920/g.70830 Transcript_21920/m.70830 type:complete len:433 (-) Transcript_21920:355-1653(-)
MERSGAVLARAHIDHRHLLVTLHLELHAARALAWERALLEKVLERLLVQDVRHNLAHVLAPGALPAVVQDALRNLLLRGAAGARVLPQQLVVLPVLKARKSGDAELLANLLRLLCCVAFQLDERHVLALLGHLSDVIPKTFTRREAVVELRRLHLPRVRVVLQRAHLLAVECKQQELIFLGSESERGVDLFAVVSLHRARNRGARTRRRRAPRAAPAARTRRRNLSPENWLCGEDHLWMDRSKPLLCGSVPLLCEGALEDTVRVPSLEAVAKMLLEHLRRRELRKLGEAQALRKLYVRPRHTRRLAGASKGHLLNVAHRRRLPQETIRRYFDHAPALVQNHPLREEHVVDRLERPALAQAMHGERDVIKAPSVQHRPCCVLALIVQETVLVRSEGRPRHGPRARTRQHTLRCELSRVRGQGRAGIHHRLCRR